MHMYKPSRVVAPAGLLLLMMALTAYSQYVIIPAMESDRIAAGGVIDAASPANPSRIDFNKLHNRSEHVEGAILLLGLATVMLVASAETGKA
jgi:hypothetical protein